MLEANFMSSMIRSAGDFTAFFSRPITAALGALTTLTWGFMLYRSVFGGQRDKAGTPGPQRG
jgi:TctA family transporter